MDPVNFINISPVTQRRPEMNGMSMKCPNCGNELCADEVFCGQCGTPNMPAPKPTRMVNPPLSRQQPPSGGYNTVMPPLSPTYRCVIQPPPINQPQSSHLRPQQQP